jgi:hypothetical protein
MEEGTPSSIDVFIPVEMFLYVSALARTLLFIGHHDSGTLGLLRVTPMLGPFQ